MKTLFTEKQHSRAHHQASTSFKHHQHGFSLIELLLVMAIIAGLMVAAFIIYPKVQAGRAANKESHILQSFQANLKSLYTKGIYGQNHEDITAVTAKAGMWPDSMIDNNKVTNEWGGKVTITVGGPNAGNTYSPRSWIRVSYPKVPADVCLKLVPSLIANWTYVRVAGQTIMAKNPPPGSNMTPYSPAKAAKYCTTNGKGSGNSVTIILTGR